MSVSEEKRPYATAADCHNEKSLNNSSHSNDPRHSQKQNDAENVLYCRQVDTHQSAHLGCLRERETTAHLHTYIYVCTVLCYRYTFFRSKIIFSFKWSLFLINQSGATSFVSSTTCLRIIVATCWTTFRQVFRVKESPCSFSDHRPCY